MNAKIPRPADLSAIEIAVWAAEYVRVRAEQSHMYGPTRADDVEIRSSTAWLASSMALRVASKDDK